MPLSQETFGQLSRKRLLITITVAVLVFIVTIVFNYMEEKNRIESQSNVFASHAIQRFDRLFSPLDVSANNSLELLGAPCEQIRAQLIEKVASLQTVRSILLVADNAIYCSSISGSINMPFQETWPGLGVNHQRMMLRTDEHLLKGSPILLFWTPGGGDNRSGYVQVVNIEMMNNYLLEPSLPWVERAVFNVGGKSLEYGNPTIEQITPGVNEVSYQKASLRYPYSITLYGPASYQLALATLPAKVPLALLLSLLTGYIIWLAMGDRVSMTWQINYGISAREFMVYCQPLINSSNGGCNGIELLLRWNNPRQGWISPDVFIPLAERQNLIAPLTRFVLKEIVHHLPELPASTSFHVAINVAASHFHKRQIIDDLENLWWPASPLPQLIVELTERDALPEVDQQFVSLLHKIGVKLAIDDFGTGHSSLSYLKTLSPDVLKIDKVFTASIGTDAINATVTDMVISLAQQLNISLVAEGVETAEQAAYLCQKGVDVLQGYYYARPMPLADFPVWLRNHQSGLPA